jgi:hypothetical protein
MTSSSSTTTDHEDTEPEAIGPETAEEEFEDDGFDDDLDDDMDDLDHRAEDEPVEAPGEPVLPSRRRRALSAVLGAVVFEVLYLLAILVIAFGTAGWASVGPTLQAVATQPFIWVPATVYLVCALVVGLPLQGARRAPVLTGLLVGVVVYLASTLFVLLVAAGPSALSVYVPELAVYPFFLTGIIAREIMAWTRWGRPRR